ncbi:ABC transporter substrate-binding protein [Rubidibacter lacunae]|uniref:ABC transporter substrate-binding protein n=1 Tax=Rubidibacter lacunae TaxID=582514 RepID=UPI001E4221B1|nr:ABC transporter substrate-binding protein [Rubidibacter lacunae]
MFVAVVGAIALLQWVIFPAFTQQPVTVKVLVQALEGAQLAPLVERFHRENPDIELDIVEAPNDTNNVEDLYTSAFLLGQSPYDLVYMDIVWVPKFAAAGWLLPLDDRIERAGIDLGKFLQGDVNGGRYRGELYRMPFRSDGGMLYYRTDWLQAVGRQPPATFDELVDVSQELQAQGLTDWGYVWQGKQYEGLSAMFVEVLAGYGAYWVDPDTLDVGLDRSEAIAAVEFLVSTITSGVSPPGVTTYSEEPVRRLFENGRTAFMRNWPYAYSLGQQSAIAGQFAIQPMVRSSQGRSGACQGGWGLGIAKTTAHPDAAWRVAEYFARAETQKQYSLETGYVPSRRELFADPELVAEFSYLPDLLNVIENSVLRPPIAQYSQASDILQRYLSAAFSRTMTPDAAMEAAARETRALLRSAPRAS